MRILVSSVGSHGHTYPLLPLSIATRDAGHEVLYATSASFHPLVERLGFRPVLAGMETREAFVQLARELGDRGPRDRASMTPDQLMVFAARVFGDVLPRRVVADLGPVLAEERPWASRTTRCASSRTPSTPGSVRTRKVIRGVYA